MNPNQMTPTEIAAQATTAQIIAGIDTALRNITTSTDRAGWSAMHAKLNEALRIKRTASPAITAPAPKYRPLHASKRMAFNGLTADGLASYGAPTTMTYPGWND
jgi:hypothetical protein